MAPFAMLSLDATTAAMLVRLLQDVGHLAAWPLAASQLIDERLGDDLTAPLSTAGFSTSIWPSRTSCALLSVGAPPSST